MYSMAKTVYCKFVFRQLSHMLHVLCKYLLGLLQCFVGEIELIVLVPFLTSELRCLRVLFLLLTLFRLFGKKKKKLVAFLLKFKLPIERKPESHGNVCCI